MAPARLPRGSYWILAVGVALSAGCQLGTAKGSPPTHDPRSEDPHDPLLDWPEDLPPLMDAARRGDVKGVRRAGRRDPSSLNARYWTPGADPRYRDCWSGMTAVHWPVRHNHPEVVDELTRLGADPEIGDGYGRTPLHWAAQQGDLGTVEVLVVQGANVNAEAVEPGGHTVKETPLHRAAVGGHADVAAYLLGHGAVVGARDRSGQTPLHWAAKAGGAQVAEVLTARGGKDVAGPRCRSHRPWPQRQSHPEHAAVAQVLLEHGAEPDGRDGLGATPLHLAKWHYADRYLK